MRAKIVSWLLLCLLANPAIVALYVATERTVWLIAHENYEALSWKPLQLAIVVGGATLLLSCVAALPAILLWSFAVARWPGLEKSMATRTFVPALVAASLAAAIAIPGELPVLSAVWVGAGALWPRLVAKGLRSPIAPPG